MPFGTLTLNSLTYDPRDPGAYALASVTFPSPVKKLVISPVSTLKSGDKRFRVSYVHEKDVTLTSGAIVRKTMLITVNVDMSTDFTPTEVDAAILCLSDFFSATTVSRMAQGEI